MIKEIKLKEELLTYSIGQVFKSKKTDDLYLLSQVDQNLINLISLKKADANRFTVPSKVSSPYEISVAELNKLKSNFLELFLPINILIQEV